MHDELARVVVAHRELSDVLHEITTVSRRAMPQTDAASITLVQSGEAFTAGYDGELALTADELQYDRGYGPCLEAGRTKQTLHIHDMRAEQRWADYTRHAAEHGVGSSLSVPLPLHYMVVGALNSYAHKPHAFNKDDVSLAEEVAGWVALAVSNAEASTMTPEQLHRIRTTMMSGTALEHLRDDAARAARSDPSAARPPQ